MSGVVEFIDAGAGISIQDLGRSGHRDIGVPLAGAADPVLLARAAPYALSLGRRLTEAAAKK